MRGRRKDHRGARARVQHVSLAGFPFEAATAAIVALVLVLGSACRGPLSGGEQFTTIPPAPEEHPSPTSVRLEEARPAALDWASLPHVRDVALRHVGQGRVPATGDEGGPVSVEYWELVSTPRAQPLEIEVEVGSLTPHDPSLPPTLRRVVTLDPRDGSVTEHGWKQGFPWGIERVTVEPGGRLRVMLPAWGGRRVALGVLVSDGTHYAMLWSEDS